MQYWVIIGEGTEFELLANLKNGAAKQTSPTAPDRIQRKVIRGEDITFTVGGKVPKVFVNGQETAPPDVFLLWGHYSELLEGLSKRLESLGAKSVNCIEGKRIVCDKLATAQLLEKENIPQAKTMVLTKLTSAQCVADTLGLPVVVKPGDGAQGIGVELKNTIEELEEYISNLPETSVSVTLAQEYIATSKGKDLRVTMIEHKPLYAIIRHAANKDEFRSNIHQGGSYEIVDIDEETVRLCEKISRAVGLRICGIDLLFGPEGYLVGEVNCTPGIRDEILKTPEFSTAMKQLVLNA